jgi:hypothetical protein
VWRRGSESNIRSVPSAPRLTSAAENTRPGRRPSGGAHGNVILCSVATSADHRARMRRTRPSPCARSLPIILARRPCRLCQFSSAHAPAASPAQGGAPPHLNDLIDRHCNHPSYPPSSAQPSSPQAARKIHYLIKYRDLAQTCTMPPAIRGLSASLLSSSAGAGMMISSWKVRMDRSASLSADSIGICAQPGGRATTHASNGVDRSICQAATHALLAVNAHRTSVIAETLRIRRHK